MFFYIVCKYSHGLLNFLPFTVAGRTLGSWFRIPLEAWLCVSVVLLCVVDRDLTRGPTPLPPSKESYKCRNSFWKLTRTLSLVKLERWATVHAETKIQYMCILCTFSELYCSELQDSLLTEMVGRCSTPIIVLLQQPIHNLKLIQLCSSSGTRKPSSY
jgi:hypothetical protein